MSGGVQDGLRSLVEVKEALYAKGKVAMAEAASPMKERMTVIGAGALGRQLPVKVGKDTKQTLFEKWTTR